MNLEEIKEMAEIKSCDYKNCHRKGGIYVGNIVDYGNSWLSDRDNYEPSVPILLCEKHAKKIFKLLGVNEDLL